MNNATRNRRRATYLSAYSKPGEYWQATGTLVNGDHEYNYVPCVYCGEPYEDEEHVYPIHQLSSVSMLTDEQKEMLIVVPACEECNGLAGHIVDESFDDRRDRVQSVLKARYKKELTRPDWYEDEYFGLGDDLAARVRHGQYEHDRAVARTTYLTDGLGQR